MFSLSLIRGAAAASLLAAAVLPAHAAAVVVDFEPGFATIGSGERYGQANTWFTAVGAGAVVDPTFCDGSVEFCPVGNATSFLTALNDTQIDVVHRRAFSLGTFQAALVPSPLVNLSGEQFRIKVSGVSLQGLAVEDSFALLEDGNTGNFMFSLYDGSRLGAVRSVTFSACYDDGTGCGASPFLNDLQFAIDDVNLNAVPEPGAAWLLALSLAGLALTRRRGTR